MAIISPLFTRALTIVDDWRNNNVELLDEEAIQHRLPRATPADGADMGRKVAAYLIENSLKPVR